VRASPERRAALAVLRDVRHGARADESFARRAGAVDPRARPFLMELAYGAIRWRKRLRWELERHLRKDARELPADVLSILELGAYQLRFMSGVPSWAAVDESVKLVRSETPAKVSRWAAGLVNAVLRNLERGGQAEPPEGSDPAARLAILHSHPQWLVARWLARLGPEATRALLERDNTPPPLHLKVNRRRADAESVIESLREAGRDAVVHPEKPDAVVIESGAAPESLPGWDEGWFWVQDVGAQWVVEMAGAPAAGWLLDACAAPGGKLVGMLERAPDVRALAIDVDADRLARVRENVTRLGLGGARLAVGDARMPPTGRRFPLVLADVPCSGTGVLRRRVDARWRRRPEDLARFAAFQREVLDGLADRVEEGGVLVYATCSLEPEENEDVVNGFLKDHPEFRLDPVGDRVPAALASGPWLATRPWIDDMDGMFAARLVRASR
jgi:16S rRNA (cytosine967-C5)-methyltransferase